MAALLPPGGYLARGWARGQRAKPSGLLCPRRGVRGGASWVDGERGAISPGSPGCIGIARCLPAVSLAGLSRAFVLRVELNVKAFGDPNYYLRPD